MPDPGLDRSKVEQFQRMLNQDPKALEKMLAQVTPEQLTGALSAFNAMGPEAKGALGNMVSGIVAKAQGPAPGKAPSKPRE